MILYGTRSKYQNGAWRKKGSCSCSIEVRYYIDMKKKDVHIWCIIIFEWVRTFVVQRSQSLHFWQLMNLEKGQCEVKRGRSFWVWDWSPAVTLHLRVGISSPSHSVPLRHSSRFGSTSKVSAQSFPTFMYRTVLTHPSTSTVTHEIPPTHPYFHDVKWFV